MQSLPSSSSTTCSTGVMYRPPLYPRKCTVHLALHPGFPSQLHLWKELERKAWESLHMISIAPQWYTVSLRHWNFCVSSWVLSHLSLASSLRSYTVSNIFCVFLVVIWHHSGTILHHRSPESLCMKLQLCFIGNYYMMQWTVLKTCCCTLGYGCIYTMDFHSTRYCFIHTSASR